ncbi:Nitrate and nitrite sensing [Fulvimarina manganoxydans]|uniref:Nitrate and nitrite sensing n=2 Tax=Fulvimarina manganoxydans TaxID=937218 RepID=A0A1W2CHQ6_9HYPH|nr:nitrate- and nitrite sensing domain-containing protein [Fulvimarina manganoxydans]SMC84494.1 Nitrate and nitrite sensing [Fulvimarina manganoxydans]
MVSEMAAAREMSDGAIARFMASETAHGADLDVRHAQIEAVIGQIGDIRSQIDALTLPGGEAFSYFTNAIAMTTDLSDRLGLGVREMELSNRLVAYSDLLAAKEFAGRRIPIVH